MFFFIFFFTSSSTIPVWVFKATALKSVVESPNSWLNFSNLGLVVSIQASRFWMKVGETRASKEWRHNGIISLLVWVPLGPARPSITNWWVSTTKEPSPLNMGTS